MKVATSGYRPTAGWSEPLATDLDSGSTLILAFGGWNLKDDPTPFRDIRAGFPGSVVLGCSTAGEIAGASVKDNTISLAATRFEKTGIRGAWTDVSGSGDSAAAGKRLAQQLLAPGLLAVFILSHGVDLNGTELAHAAARVLPDGVSVSRGLAGDGARLASSWVLCRREPWRA